MTTLSINFWKKGITEEKKAEFMTAVNHEKVSMLILQCDDTIARLEKRLENKEKAEDSTQVEIDALKAEIEEARNLRSDLETKQVASLEVYNAVMKAMTDENSLGYGNKKTVVSTVLRVLATWDNAGLVKYAITPAFRSPALYEALQAIHVNSLAGEFGNITMSKDVKEAYKKASVELEKIVKTTFSLSVETPYTEKTRVKITAEDKKLLNDCYVKGFSNKIEANDDGVVSFKKRTVNTLVKEKVNKKTGEKTYNYSGLASTIANIVIMHYFK